MKKKTAVVIAVLGAGAIIGSCAMEYMNYRVFAKDDEFRIEGSTLTAYLGDDTFVSIPDYVTTIGKEAFFNNTTVKSVEFPDKLKTIEINAFGGCTSLQDVTLPESVTKVGAAAFAGCTSLTSFEIGSQVNSWGTAIFLECSSLSKVIVDEENLYLTYYNGALYNGDMSFLYQVLPGREGENYVMPDEVEEIDVSAFRDMQNLKNVMVSDNVSQIWCGNFANMGSVETIVLPASIDRIEEGAFSDNISLKQVLMPVEVNEIQDKAFSYCPNVKLLVKKDSTAESYAKKNNYPVIYEAEYPIDFVNSNESMEEKPGKTVKVVREKKLVVKNGEEVTESSVKDSEEDSKEESQVQESYEHPLDTQEDGVIGKTIIVGGKAIVLIGEDNQKVYGSKSENSTKENAKTEETKEETTEASKEEHSEQTVKETTTSTEKTEKEKETADKASSNKVSSTKNTNLNENQIIKEREYYKQKKLTNYEIGETIKEIQRLAFARSGLTSIEIPNHVETIGYGAFYACENLEEVTIPDSVTTVETKAFADTPWLKNWLNGGNEAGDGSDFLIVGDGILIAYRGTNSKVSIPDTVKQIGSEAFKGHAEIEEVIIPKGVKKINAEAFRNCTNLKSVVGCEGLKTIIHGAFYGTQVDEDNLQ